MTSCTTINLHGLIVAAYLVMTTTAKQGEKWKESCCSLVGWAQEGGGASVHPVIFQTKYHPFTYSVPFMGDLMTNQWWQHRIDVMRQAIK
jgi:hypothetical protein